MHRPLSSISSSLWMGWGGVGITTSFRLYWSRGSCSQLDSGPRKAPGCLTCFSLWTGIYLFCFQSLWLQTRHPLWALVEKPNFLLLGPTPFFFLRRLTRKFINCWLSFQFSRFYFVSTNPGCWKNPVIVVPQPPRFWGLNTASHMDWACAFATDHHPKLLIVHVLIDFFITDQYLSETI